MNETLDKLKAHFGSYSKMAKALGITRQAINDWRVKQSIPSGCAIEIERLTEGEFKAVDLTK